MKLLTTGLVVLLLGVGVHAQSGNRIRFDGQPSDQSNLRSYQSTPLQQDFQIQYADAVLAGHANGEAVIYELGLTEGVFGASSAAVVVDSTKHYDTLARRSRRAYRWRGGSRRYRCCRC